MLNDDEIRALCNWYLTVDRSIFPAYPFQLTAHQTVTGEAFFDALTREARDTINYLNGGASLTEGVQTSPPVRLAALLKDLQALKSLSFAQIDDNDVDW
jgi:hypothetical protein